jgi:hypothetical protein
MQESLLQNYICAVPFTSLEIDKHSRFLCCASWLKKHLPRDTTPKEAWNSEDAKDIRESILDGTYRYCDKTQCPFLSELLTKNSTEFNETVFEKPLHHKNSLPGYLKNAIVNHYSGNLAPSTIQFSFDRTCNLKCPSCRLDIIAASSAQIKEIEQTINLIQQQYSKDVTTLYITGTGDPFVSVGFRNFLRNFEPKLWPKLQRIHLHTNATKWTREMWDSMPKVHKYIKSCEISIDAGSKSTYEEYTRLGGDWDTLIENLYFISTIKTLKYIKTSFVVQKANYKEMKIFYNLMTSIFKNKASIFYGRINNWGTYNEAEYLNECVHNKNHPEHELFLQELRKTLPAKNAWTNLQELLEKTNKIF